METDSRALLENLDKLHTTILGVDRIKKNLDLSVDDVVAWCKAALRDKRCGISRKGKNWYADIDAGRITINAHSYTIITAHRKK
ncbi:MAG TPA: DUF3781 domain-containing protein [Treponemataceae bacterium]|nr:DUF3781 domain-containing protein [Treponemataceae bacterium]HPS44693.1 DUF3781 domain-containing protein [Treponemataceae bacterium]